MTTTLQVDPARLGWLAGLIEGEGWIGVRDGRPCVQVVSTDRDVVDRLLEWSGVGSITGPTTRGPNRKPVHHWRVTRRDDAAALLDVLLPLLCERRAARARDVLAEWREHGPTRGTADTCGKGHDLTDPTNVRVLEDGGYLKRRCLACQARRQREHRARRRAATA